MIVLNGTQMTIIMKMRIFRCVDLVLIRVHVHEEPKGTLHCGVTEIVQVMSNNAWKFMKTPLFGAFSNCRLWA